MGGQEYIKGLRRLQENTIISRIFIIYLNNWNYYFIRLSTFYHLFCLSRLNLCYSIKSTFLKLFYVSTFQFLFFKLLPFKLCFFKFSSFGLCFFRPLLFWDLFVQRLSLLQVFVCLPNPLHWVKGHTSCMNY